MVHIMIRSGGTLISRMSSRITCSRPISVRTSENVKFVLDFVAHVRHIFNLSDGENVKPDGGHWPSHQGSIFISIGISCVRRSDVQLFSLKCITAIAS